MATAEEAARREAVARMLQGEPAGKVAADLGRTERWVRKWVARYDPADEGWAQDRSRAPQTVANRTSEETERVVLEIRQRLMANPWAQVGFGAVAWEMTKLGLDPPESRTLERILAVGGGAEAASPPRPLRPQGDSVSDWPIPAARRRPPRDRPGGTAPPGGWSPPFHALNAIDVGRRNVAIEILDAKSEREVAAGLVGIWARLGVPRTAQFDNGQTIHGTQGHLGLPVRLALAVGARVRFIPFGEPWRNRVIEHFNDVFDKRFFRTQRFGSRDELREARVFEAFHNPHRYRALKGATPDEHEQKLAFAAPLLDPATLPPVELPRKGLVEFVRLIRSDRILKVLGAAITLPEELIHRYVTATLHLRTHRLVIDAHGHYFRMELPFRLRP